MFLEPFETFELTEAVLDVQVRTELRMTQKPFSGF